jgi:hypothetical protein
MARAVTTWWLWWKCYCGGKETRGGEGGTGPDPTPLCCYEALERNFYFFTNSRILSLWTHSDPFRLNRVS